MTMTLHIHGPRRAALVIAVAAALAPAVAGAQINFSSSPLFLGTMVKPNVLVVYDNSQSMDGTMAGKLIAGDDPSTRGNIARSVLRSTITSYRNSFQWGLASFALTSSKLYTTYPYFFGSDAQVVYTNDCVGGVSASNGNLRCVANPQPANGFNFLTYALTGDDPEINDVLYAGDYGPQLYGIGVANSTNYQVYTGHGAGSGWAAANFSGGQGTWGFTPTDAGFLPGMVAPRNDSRMFWLRRAWGYLGNISGRGKINQPVAADSAAQYNALMAFLASETNAATGELKNAALFTPLAGTLDTVKSYFANTLPGNATPITQSCQRNFVLLATDGNPTGKTDGSMYSLADQLNSQNVAGAWTFGVAENDVFNRVSALRNVTLGANSYDIQTYVVGLGDSVANPSSVATLDRMADLGGTSSAYLANNAQALADAFNRISIDIISRTAAASAVSLNSGSWNTGSKVYQGRFSSGEWSGQLLAFAIGANGQPAAAADWDAGQVINGQNWNAGRQVLTYKPSVALGSRGVAFRWPANPAAPAAAEIDGGMVTALNTNIGAVADGFGAQRLAYLRGDTSLEMRNCGACAAPVFRNRPTSVLGDIIDSAPVYVGGGTGDFRDTIEAPRYSSYVATRAALAPVIYVGANDGMLHAFSGVNGKEVFAYVPWALRNRLSALTSSSYTHQYSADGSPAVGDVFVGGSWRTMLVSGMNSGAQGLFALDVTDPTKFNEANAAAVVRWEIDGSDADVGYVFGRPILAKMRDGVWRAIVGNGYNSTNGVATLLLLDLQSGAITRISTGVAGGNGLSGVAAVSKNDDGVVDYVYAGDLKGNLWKFDLSASAPAGWKVAYTSGAAPAPLFAAGAGKPITARPDIVRFPQGGYLVTFGTGRYLDVSDNAAGGVQTLYGIRDNGTTVAAADLQTQSIVGVVAGADGHSYRQSTHAVGAPSDAALPGDNAISLASYYATKKGWKLDLPSAGERIVADTTARFGRVIASTLIPNNAVCSFGGDGWIFDVDVITGNRSPALDTNADNTIDANDLINGTAASAVHIATIPAAASIMRSKNRSLDDKLINTSGGTIERVRETGNATPSRRASWEQLQ